GGTRFGGPAASPGPWRSRRCRSPRGLFARKASAQGSIPPEIIDALNFALTLERLEDEFYKAALATDGLDLGTARPAIEQIGRHETAHVTLLTNTLGVAALPAPLAQGFEDLGVRAYKGQVPLLATQPELITTALRIHSTEARHAAMLRRLSQSPADRAWITGSTNSAGALQPIYDGEELTTQLGIDLLQFGSADRASEAFDEPIARETVEEFIIPAEPPPEA
ncbi:MAG TPA: ferritin-like domain-containing protein, partial [Gemmatimonadales bacterium]|nr:ferritin-like domain-containing protein [Gemmatimonadales bacterium]